MNHDLLATVARDFGTPCYVYFADALRERVDALRAAFGGRFHVSYAVKANPNSVLLRRLRDWVDGLDVSSGGELARALAAGWDAARISFTGPGKTAGELEYAVAARIGEVVVESVDEAATLNAISGQAGHRQPILARLAPLRVPRGFGLNMSGKPTQFGLDEETLDASLRTIRALPHLELVGLHIYSGTQCLAADAIAENYRLFSELFRSVCSAQRLTPRKLVYGAGIGIPYHEGEAAPDLAAIAAGTQPALEAIAADPALRSAELVLETGRFLIGEAGVFLTRVIRTKESRGTTLCICDGGMNQHLAASGHFGSVLQRNYRMFRVGSAGTPPAANNEYTLVGPLCTTIDTLGRRVAFDALRAGDVVGILSSGAYGVTASPIHFISHRPPREVLVETIDGRPRMEDCTQFVEPPWNRA
jgi:diaminopimelate decarboxylase